MYFLISDVSQCNCKDTMNCTYKVFSTMGMRCKVTSVVLSQHAELPYYLFVLPLYVGAT